MDQQHIVQFVRTVPLFHQFTREQLEGIAGAFEVRSFEENDLVLKPGSAESQLYIAVQGEFQVLIDQDSLGIEVELARLYPGDYFGDMALVSGRSLSAFIRAVTPGLALCLSKSRFDELFESSTAFARQVCWSLADAVVSAVDQLGVVPHMKLDRFEQIESAVGNLSPRICRACRCLVVEQRGGDATVALVDPSDSEVRSFLAQALRPLRVKWVAVTEQDFQSYAARLLGKDSFVADEIAPFESLNYTSQTGESGPLIEAGANDLLARILTEAIRRRASDVHLEPGYEHAAARLHIDGRMAACKVELNRVELRSLVSQIKVMSNIDITRGFLPQDGNFSLRADDQELEVRVSTIPCHGGEKAVLRLVLPNPEFGWLENLVLSAPLCQLASDVFHSPHGLVLVTGPTGAGKTTTLYAALNSIWRRDSSINLVTIEDPIEYNLPFATQTQINRAAGLQFSGVMRSLLRQDPDVILVGEIRDDESAAMALDAATTGHLVLSSLHTHSAMETLARLRQLNVKPYLLADALQGVISQRLVPRQRPEFCEEVPDDDPSVQHLQRIGVLTQPRQGVLRRPPNPSDDSGGEQVACGRIAVFEMLAVTPSLRNLIECDAPVATMVDRLEPNSFIGMKDYCRFLLEKGLISPESAASLFSRFEGPTVRSTRAGEIAAT